MAVVVTIVRKEGSARDASGALCYDGEYEGSSESDLAAAHRRYYERVPLAFYSVLRCSIVFDSDTNGNNGEGVDDAGISRNCTRVVTNSVTTSKIRRNVEAGRVLFVIVITSHTQMLMHM